MITIIDYGMGNLRSVQKALEYLGAKTLISSDPQEINKAQKAILPGVGAFNQAMQNLQQKNLLGAIEKLFQREIPFLGICLGMQLLLSSSNEYGFCNGINKLSGYVKHFRENKDFNQDLNVPHIGWNQVKQFSSSKLFKGLPKIFQVYFVHSYFAEPQNGKIITGITNYGFDFCSAYEDKNIFGVQFHPEKSGETGLEILKNFILI